MRHFFLTRGLLIGLLFLCIGSVAQAASYTPKPGSAQRKAVLDALRTPVSKYLKKNVIFNEVEMSVSGNWAYVFAGTIDKNGKKIGPEWTTYVSALLRKSGSKWRTLEWDYATDVISIEWEKKYPGAPRSIWPHRR